MAICSMAAWGSSQLVASRVPGCGASQVLAPRVPRCRTSQLVAPRMARGGKPRRCDRVHHHRVRVPSRRDRGADRDSRCDRVCHHRYRGGRGFLCGDADDASDRVCCDAIALRRCDAEISSSSMRRVLCGDADDAATATAVAFRRCDADDDSDRAGCDRACHCRGAGAGGCGCGCGC